MRGPLRSDEKSNNKILFAWRPTSTTDSVFVLGRTIFREVMGPYRSRGQAKLQCNLFIVLNYLNILPKSVSFCLERLRRYSISSQTMYSFVAPPCTGDDEPLTSETQHQQQLKPLTAAMTSWHTSSAFIARTHVNEFVQLRPI